MNDISKLYNEIKSFKPFDEREEVDKNAMIEFMDNNKDVLTRDNHIGHLTTSAWIVNKERTKVLMIYHNIFKSWAWVGGHADGEADLLSVVKREIKEETGITNIKLLSDGIYGINVSPVDSHIKRGKIVNSHLHLDIEYLFEADENDEIRIKEDENSGIKWIDIDKVVDSCLEEKMKPVYDRLNKKLKTI